MNLDDFAQQYRAKTGKQAAAPAPAAAQPLPADPEESSRIRARMIGVLVRDAREHSGRSIEECAQYLHLDPEALDAWESGDSAPTLPQLEMLAYYLDVPVSHFWGMTTLEASTRSRARAQDEYLALRDRMVGALLRQARERRSITLDALAEDSGLSADQIERYEMGDEPIPMHALTVLANGVQVNLEYFLESRSQIGELLALKGMWQHFAELPEPIRAFAANPMNIGFIEIAIMFSKMPVDSLRRVGESALNIAL